MQGRIETAINQMKDSLTKVKSSQLAFEAGLMDPDMIDRMIGFTSFLSTWLIRQVDPKKAHPNPPVQ
jgi:ubiquitin conjugation factor E4 B